MFAFRTTNPKRKDATKQPAAAAAAAKPRPYKFPVFANPNPHDRHRDDSSFDESLYTTRSKATIRYNRSFSNYYDEVQSDDETEYTTEVALMRSKQGGWTAAERMHNEERVSSLLTHATDPMTPSEEEFSMTASSFDFFKAKTPMAATERVAARFTFKEKQSPATRSLPDRDDEEAKDGSSPSPSHYLQHTGPVDLDESIVDSCSIASSSNSWVMFATGVASPEIYQQQEAAPEDECASACSSFHQRADESATLDSSSEQRHEQHAQEEFSVMSPIPFVHEDEEELESPYVWTDNEDEEEEVALHSHENKQRQWSRDDENIISRTYTQAMESISTSKRRSDTYPLAWEEEDEDPSPGEVLLTAGELEKHMKRVQQVEALPSSSIDGYDTWKRQLDYKQRYFAKLQESAAKRKKERDDRRQPPQTSRANTSIERRQPHDHRHQPEQLYDARYQWCAGTMKDSTRSAMDQSIDSSIPTIETAYPKSRRKIAQKAPPRRRRWKLFPLFQSSKKKNKKASSSSQNKETSSLPSKKKREPAPVVSLESFMRISSDEPSTVAAFSLAPLNTMGHITLASSLPAGDTLAATQSHFLEGGSNEGRPKQLAFHYLEEERQKQRLAEAEKGREEEIEQERIEKLKQQELERQRRLIMPRDKPPRQRRTPNSSSDQGSMNKCHDSLGSANKSYGSVRSKKTKSTKDTDSTSYPSEVSILEKSPSVCSKQSVDSSLQSRSASMLAPCILCNAAERSYIAMPCMHFSFCGTCVEQMHQSEDTFCPVCNAQNVAFTRVFTGC